MERIATCTACRYKELSVKTRIAIPHTCGFPENTQLFYAKERPKTTMHKWGEPEQGMDSFGKYVVRECVNCGCRRIQSSFFTGEKRLVYNFNGDETNFSPECLF